MKKNLQLSAQEVKWDNGLQNIFQVQSFEVTGYDSESKILEKTL